MEKIITIIYLGLISVCLILLLKPWLHEKYLLYKLDFIKKGQSIYLSPEDTVRAIEAYNKRERLKKLKEPEGKV